MKKLPLIVFLIAFAWQAAPSNAYAAASCVNNVSTATGAYCTATCIDNVSTLTGTTCVIVTPNPPSGAGGAGNTLGNTTGTVGNGSCPNGGTLAANGSCNLGYTPLEPIPGITSGNGFDVTNPNNLHLIIQAIFKVLFTIGALIAVLSLTIGGVQYMVSEAVHMKTAGLERAQAAIWGMVLLAGAYLILYTINPQLLQFQLNPCPSGSVGCTIAGPVTTNSTAANAAPNGPACGTSYPNGCPANYACGQEDTSGGMGAGPYVQTCLYTNQPAKDACAAQSGGQWVSTLMTTSQNAGYCYLSNIKTSTDCQSAGGTWTIPWYTYVNLYSTVTNPNGGYYCYK